MKWWKVCACAFNAIMTMHFFSGWYWSAILSLFRCWQQVGPVEWVPFHWQSIPKNPWKSWNIRKNPLKSSGIPEMCLEIFINPSRISKNPEESHQQSILIWKNQYKSLEIRKNPWNVQKNPKESLINPSSNRQESLRINCDPEES